MSGLRIIKYFKGPAFTAGVWSTRNPYLRSGEIGYLLDAGIVIGGKVGPGYWNDLEFIGEDIYNYPDAVTNPIGDASGTLQGTKVVDIINKMLSPYEEPEFLNIQNNTGGVFANIRIREIGQSISTTTVIYNLLHNQNLVGNAPINITADGIYNNEGDYADTGSIALTVSSPVFPTLPQTITIRLKANHTNGLTSGVDSITQIKFVPRIMWLNSINTPILDGATFMSLGNRESVLSDDFRAQDYLFSPFGYLWFAIPAMLSPGSNLSFANVIHPESPSYVDMNSAGTITINNGIGNYSYNLYRSTYNIVIPTKIRIT